MGQVDEGAGIRRGSVDDPAPALEDELQGTLDAIGLLTAITGHTPSVSDVARMMMTPYSTVHSRVLRLRLQGLVERGTKYTHGTITLTKAGQDACSSVEWID